MKGIRTTASFFDLAEKHIRNLKRVHNYNQAISDNSKINIFREFVNNNAFTFQDIDQKLLTNFQNSSSGKRYHGRGIHQKYYPSFSDGAIDNVYIERFFRVIKYAKLYIEPSKDGLILYKRYKEFIQYYNKRRLHS